MRRVSLSVYIPPPAAAVNYSSIRHLLELTEGETDLDSDKEIPDIFSKVKKLHTPGPTTVQTVLLAAACSIKSSSHFEPNISSIQVDQLQHYSDISRYKDGVLGSEVKPYLDEFSGTVKQEQLMVGKMTLEQVEVGCACMATVCVHLIANIMVCWS